MDQDLSESEAGGGDRKGGGREEKSELVLPRPPPTSFQVSKAFSDGTWERKASSVEESEKRQGMR